MVAPAGHKYIFQPAVSRLSRTGESDQPVVIDLLVGKRDQRLVFAAIVPQKRARRETGSRLIQDRFAVCVHQYLFLLFPVELFVSSCCIEEIRGRHLPGVTGDHHLFSSVDRADRILGKDL